MKTRKQKKKSVSLGRSTRSKTTDSGRESSTLPIPIELIIDIFSRLPLKSITICRCVSKPWASTLRHQDFTDLFLTKSSTRPQLLFARQKDGNLFFYSSPQPHNLVENSSVSANSLMNFSDFNFDSSYKINGLVHGLFCLADQRISKRKIDMVPVLCSPSTGQTLILPKLNTRSARVKFLLGYDPVDKQFKVLSMTQPLNGMVSEEHQVLTLGTGKMPWRLVQCSIPHLYPREAMCISGVLYYKSHYRSCMIVCFDVRSEKFRFIEVKGSLRSAVLGTMVNCNGKLGFTMSEERNPAIISGRSTRFRLWVLEDVERQEWSERVYLLPAEWKNVVGEHVLRFVGVVARTNEIVLSSWYAVKTFYLFYFNPARNTVVRVEIEGVDMDGSKFAVLQTFLDHVEDVKLFGKRHKSMTQPLNGREPRDDMVSEEHQVLTFGSGKMSWRLVRCSIPHLYPREAICIDGVLYYNTSHYRSCMIVCFDVMSEKFSLIEVVKGSLGRAVLLGNMVNCNGKLGLIVSETDEGEVGVSSGRSVRFVLWVIEDVEKQEWSERVYVLPAEWKNVVGEHMLNFVGVVARTNEIVLSSLYTVNPFYLFYFNPERNTVVRVEIRGLDMHASKYGMLQTFLDHVEDVKLYAKVH